MAARHRSKAPLLHGRRGLLFLTALAAAVAGVVVLAVALRAQQSAPEPSVAARGRISVPTSGVPRRVDPSPSVDHPGGGPTTSQARTRPPGPSVLQESLPTSIDIPAIGVQSSIISLGQNADGSLQVPPPGPDENTVAWLDDTPTPGQAGPSVFEGHVDTAQGASIFFRLGALVPGDRIEIGRADGTTVVFTMNAVRAYAAHDDLPVAEIFGAELAVPSLRLITCSDFDHATGHYIGNTVVYAHLTSVQRH